MRALGPMKQSIVLGLRAAVFVLAVFSKIHFRESFSLRYSCKTQILLASVQMALSIAGIAVYQACQYVVMEINESARYTTMPDDDEIDFDIEDSLEAAHATGAASVAPAPEPTSRPDPLEIDVVVFASASALRAYVRRIHLTALLVWGTFYSIDMGEYEVLNYFVVGIFLGWVALLLGTRPISLVRSVSMSSTMYVLLCLGILAVNQPSSKPSSPGDVLAVCVLPVVFGLAWMLWIEAHTVVEDSKSTFVTCSLLCGLVMATGDWSELRRMLASSRVVFVFLLIAEPLIKCLALSVLVVSVQTQQRKTIMLVFVTTYAMANLYQGLAGMDSSILFYCTVGMTALLVAMQLVTVLIADCRGCGRDAHSGVGAGAEARVSDL